MHPEDGAFVAFLGTNEHLDYFTYNWLLSIKLRWAEDQLLNCHSCPSKPAKSFLAGTDLAIDKSDRTLKVNGNALVD